MLEFSIKTLLAYLLGSLIGSLLVGRLRQVDIRTLGSGNAGGTNALRTQGPAFAIAVILIDIGKGLLAVGLLPGVSLPGVGIDASVDRQWLAVGCAIAVVIGHVYPVWYEFRGGKGAATLIGAVAMLSPLALIPVLVVWLVSVTCEWLCRAQHDARQRHVAGLLRSCTTATTRRSWYSGA